MTSWLGNFVDANVQCWGCGIFDSLFRVISAAAAALYGRMTIIGMLIFCAFLALYILWAFWKNISDEKPEPMYQKYLKPVIINSIVVLGLLSMGVFAPRLITTMTMEPVADMTLIYTQSMLNQTPESVDAKVTYQPQPMPDNGFYRPHLRDSIIELMKTSITTFQAMIKMGLSVMDGAFSWSALTGIGALVKHALMFFIGLALAFGFFKIFIKFCFYFVDVIVALTFFAFFFPISLVFFVFKNSSAAEWVKKLGDNMAPKMLQNAINSIATLGTVVITYVVILVLISRFFSANDAGGAALANQILSGGIYDINFADSDLATMTLASFVVLLYIVQYLADHIKDVAKMVTDTFKLAEPATNLRESLFNDAQTVTGNVLKFAKDTGKIVWNGITGKEPEKPTGTGKPDTPDAKKPTEDKSKTADATGGKKTT
ncbi:MAG: hypothetical protein FWC51_03420 [Proteobacteria bacterium]|nr:hypothetical protein [Pseudomonadota bacterium]